MDFKILLAIPLIAGALAKGCIREADDIARAGMKTEATLTERALKTGDNILNLIPDLPGSATKGNVDLGNEIIQRVIARIPARILANSSLRDSIFGRSTDYDSLRKKSIYAMALLEGQTTQDSTDLSDLFLFTVRSDLSTFIGWAFDSTKQYDPLFSKGRLKFRSIYLSYKPAYALKSLKYAESNFAAENDPKQARIKLNKFIEKVYFPYGRRVSEYYFSDSVQTRLKKESEDF